MTRKGTRRGGGLRDCGLAGNRSIRRLEAAALISGAQHDRVVGDTRLNPALDLALGDPVQHCSIGLRWLGAEIAVLCGEVAEIFRDGPHRGEWLVEPFKRTAEGPIRDGQDLAGIIHRRGPHTFHGGNIAGALFESMDRPG